MIIDCLILERTEKEKVVVGRFVVVANTRKNTLTGKVRYDMMVMIMVEEELCLRRRKLCMDLK